MQIQLLQLTWMKMKVLSIILNEDIKNELGCKDCITNNLYKGSKEVQKSIFCRTKNTAT